MSAIPLNLRQTHVKTNTFTEVLSPQYSVITLVLIGVPSVSIEVKPDGLDDFITLDLPVLEENKIASWAIGSCSKIRVTPSVVDTPYKLYVVQE